LIEQFYKTKSPIVLPSTRRRGHPVIFSASLYDELLSAALETGARAVVWAHKGEIEEVRTKKRLRAESERSRDMNSRTSAKD